MWYPELSKQPKFLFLITKIPLWTNCGLNINRYTVYPDDSFSECILCKILNFEYYSQYVQINIWCWLLIFPNIKSVKHTLALYGFLTNLQFYLFILVESLTAFREDQFVNPYGEERWHKGLKGTVSRDFLLLVFFMNQFPPSPWVYH